MALPTTNLTLHCRADLASDLFTTYSSGGTHTGVPTDGGAVQVWEDEGDGISDVIWRYLSATGQSPAYRSSSPFMQRPCLDFDGSTSVYGLMNQAGLANKALSSLITNTAYTIMMVFYAEAIVTAGANPYERVAIISDSGAFFGIHVNDVSGTKQVFLYNWDGVAETVTLNISAGHTWIVVGQHSGGNLLLSTIDENGTQVDATPVVSGNTQDLTHAPQLGVNYDLAGFYNGRIGELAIWNAALTGQTLTDAIQWFKGQWLATTPVTPAQLIPGAATRRPAPFSPPYRPAYRTTHGR